MELTRRGFITGLGALIAAPAIIKVAGIMPIKVEKPWRLWGDDFHDDTAALDALLRGERVVDWSGKPVAPRVVPPGVYKVSGPLILQPGAIISRSSFRGHHDGPTLILPRQSQGGLVQNCFFDGGQGPLWLDRT